MFDYWEKIAEDPSVILLEKMSYDLKTFKVPKIFQRVANDCFNKKRLKYSDPGGLTALKTAIRDYEIALNPVLKNKDSMILIGNGASEIFFYVVKAILKLPENTSRKKFVLFKPGYPFFDNCITNIGGICTYVRGSKGNQFMPSIERIEASFKDDVCAIVLVNPHNPTGISYPKEYLSKIVALAKKKNIIVVSDEVYAELLKSQYTHHSIFEINQSYNHVVRIFGPAKDRPGFTGIRIGYCIGDKRLERPIFEAYLTQSFAMNTIAEYLLLYDIILRTYFITNNKQVLTKDITENELRNYQKTIAKNYKIIFDRQNAICRRFDKMKNFIEYIQPHGGNMIFFSYKHNQGKNFSFTDLGLGLYPGDFFHQPSSPEHTWARICLTTDKKSLDTGLKKLGV
jgi:aspartate/methionine/tyrosine aminotransferase